MLVQGLSGEAVEIVTKCRISCPVRELSTQMITWQPAGPLAVGHDVGDRLTVHGEDHPLTGPHGVDDLTRLICEVRARRSSCATVKHILSVLPRRGRSSNGLGGGSSRCT